MTPFRSAWPGREGGGGLWEASAHRNSENSNTFWEFDETDRFVTTPVTHFWVTLSSLLKHITYFNWKKVKKHSLGIVFSTDAPSKNKTRQKCWRITIFKDLFTSWLFENFNYKKIVWPISVHTNGNVRMAEMGACRNSHKFSKLYLETTLIVTPLGKTQQWQ